jgi:cobalt-zinc-cadmium efflux system protein
MAHNHDHEHRNSNIKVAFFLNVTFTVIEIISGILFNSMAILSDALHDLGDSFSLGLAWWMQEFSKKESNELYSYGYRRYSLLSALINALILVAGSVVIIYNAVPRIFNPEATNAQGMIGIAILGIIVNGVAVFKSSGGKALNEQVISWHLLEDVFGWSAVLVVGIIMYFKEWYILDPLISIIITLFILYNILKKLKETLLVFLQTVPEEIDLDQLIDSFLAIEQVIDTHHTHIWSLDSEYHVLTTHLVVHKNTTVEEFLKIKLKVKKLCQRFNIEHLTIQVDYEDESCDYQLDDSEVK